MTQYEGYRMNLKRIQGKTDAAKRINSPKKVNTGND